MPSMEPLALEEDSNKERDRVAPIPPFLHMMQVVAAAAPSGRERGALDANTHPSPWWGRDQVEPSVSRGLLWCRPRVSEKEQDRSVRNDVENGQSEDWNPCRNDEGQVKRQEFGTQENCDSRLYQKFAELRDIEVVSPKESIRTWGGEGVLAWSVSKRYHSVL